MKYADLTEGKPIAVWLQSVSGVDAINPLVAFYDIHGRKREVIFFVSDPNTTRDLKFFYLTNTLKEWKKKLKKYCALRLKINLINNSSWGDLYLYFTLVLISLEYFNYSTAGSQSNFDGIRSVNLISWDISVTNKIIWHQKDFINSFEETNCLLFEVNILAKKTVGKHILMTGLTQIKKGKEIGSNLYGFSCRMRRVSFVLYTIYYGVITALYITVMRSRCIVMKLDTYIRLIPKGVEGYLR
jgi:hypothetical protein